MESSASAPTTVRFGVYEADLATGELRKRGRRIALQEQPSQVLVLLLRHRGEIVTREELQQALWRGDTFVEFEHGVNTAIMKLRQALGDEADNPRFIETLPRKGYRFIAAVEVETPAAPATAPALVLPPERPHRQRWIWILSPAAVLAIVLTTGLWPLSEPKIRITALTSDVRDKELFPVLSPGRVFYTAAQLGAQCGMRELWSIPAAGGEPRREPTPCPPGITPGIAGSPNYIQGRLLFTCLEDWLNIDFYLAGLDGSNAKWIGRYNVYSVGGQGVTISPDLKTLLFTRSEGLFTKPVNGGAERLLTRVDGLNLFGTVWHPSGTKITLQRAVNGPERLWEVRADGTGLRPLLPEFAAEQTNALWAPDGRRLYFLSRGDIYLTGSRGWLGWMRRPVPVRLTSGPIQFGAPVEDPADPLAVYAVGGTAQATALKLNRKTNAWEPFLGGTAADEIAFSPDGQSMAYVSYPDGKLWKCRKDGSSKVLLEDELFVVCPRWSPDGTRIVFSTAPPGTLNSGAKNAGPSVKTWRIYTISSSGGDRKPVPGVPGSAIFADWSPDGKRLVFSPHWIEVSSELYHASIVNLETGAVEPVPGSEGAFALAWSPDGNWLAGVTLVESSPYLYSFATRKWTELGHYRGNYPHWSKDSRYLYFMEWTPRTRLVRIEISTQKAEVIREIGEFDVTGIWCSDAAWMPGEEPVVLRTLSTQQIYRIDRDR